MLRLWICLWERFSVSLQVWMKMVISLNITYVQRTYLISLCVSLKKRKPALPAKLLVPNNVNSIYHTWVVLVSLISLQNALHTLFAKWEVRNVLLIMHVSGKAPDIEEAAGLRCCWEQGRAGLLPYSRNLFPCVKGIRQNNNGFCGYNML